jgi:hypothetical protein
MIAGSRKQGIRSVGLERLEEPVEQRVQVCVALGHEVVKGGRSS